MLLYKAVCGAKTLYNAGAEWSKPRAVALKPFSVRTFWNIDYIIMFSTKYIFFNFNNNITIGKCYTYRSYRRMLQTWVLQLCMLLLHRLNRINHMSSCNVPVQGCLCCTDVVQCWSWMTKASCSSSHTVECLNNLECRLNLGVQYRKFVLFIFLCLFRAHILR